MPTTLPARRRAASVQGRKPKGNVVKQDVEILWVLALDGDINEPHKGGNASKTLNARLKDRGVKVDPKNIYNRMTQMENRGQLQRVMKDSKCYAIRLKVDPESVGPNPFAKTVTARGKGKSEVAVAKTNGNSPSPILSAVQTMSIRERLELATELIRGIQTDLDRFDGVRI